MRRLRAIVTSLGVLSVLALAAHAQIADATYIGGKRCALCHRARNKDLVEAYPATAHAKALLEPTDENIVADFANAPFQRDQVAWVLASGRHEQAYLDKELKVLPGLWSVSDKKWLPQEAVDGGTECVGCHVTGYDPETREWKEAGVGCERCHGGGSLHMKAKADDRKSTIVTPSTLTPQLQAADCGQCHSRGRSKDGKYAFPQGYVPGTDLAACFDDAKPETAGRNQQYSDLIRSPKHWENGVVCEKCHDPHGATEHPFQLRLPINETCVQCHKDKADLAAHAKAKDKTPAADATCATCHMPNGRHLFDKAVAD